MFARFVLWLIGRLFPDPQPFNYSNDDLQRARSLCVNLQVDADATTVHNLACYFDAFRRSIERPMRVRIRFLEADRDRAYQQLAELDRPHAVSSDDRL